MPKFSAGFFAGVCAPGDATAHFSDPPPPCHPWIASCPFCLCLTGFLLLTGVDVYSLLRYLVLGNKLQGGK